MLPSPSDNLYLNSNPVGGNSMHTIGFVAKDIMAARALAPIATALCAEHRVTVFLEGKALKEFPANIGKRIVVGSEEKPEKETRSSDDYDAVLRDHPVDVIIVGTSSPIHAERGLALTANRTDIPVAAFSDIWGGEGRLGNDVKVDLWFATDETHRDMISHNVALGPSRENTVIVGFPSYELLMKRPTEEMRLCLAQYGDPEWMLLVVGQDYGFLFDIMCGAVALLRGTPGLKLVPRLWHPKIGPNENLQRQFNEMVKWFDLEGRIVRISDDDMKKLSTDTLAVLCGATISATTTTLLVAGASGNRAISVHSNATVEGLRAETGLDYYPPATADGPIYKWDIDKPEPLMPERDIATIPRGRYEVTPFAPEKATTAILGLIK